jgi:HD-GYP domain-containing protein (c-di-GMP phosphodiesterase class II)
MPDPRAVPWADVVEALHALLTAVVVRGQYPAAHPALERADQACVGAFARLVPAMQELVVAIVEGEFVVAERPMPELRARLLGLAETMLRHGIECLVFVPGVTRSEITILASSLALPAAEDRGHARERLQAQLPHVLLRFAELRENKTEHEAERADNLVPGAREVLASVEAVVARGGRIDLKAIRKVARGVLDACVARAAPLQLRSHDPADDGPGHAANTAIMTCVMLLEAGLTDEICVDGTAAALLHDVGCALLPQEVRGTPEPLLDDEARKIYRFHPILGARALLLAGAPGTWVEVALQHHRGVDLHGYPALDSDRPPHELARIVALANFVERKRTSLAGAFMESEPEATMAQCTALLGKYFDGRCIALFMRALGIFPPGTTVELSTGDSAVVTRVYVGEPLRPRVRLLFGHDAGKRLDLREFDALERRYARSIVRAIAPPLAVPARPARPTSDASETDGGRPNRVS